MKHNRHTIRLRNYDYRLQGLYYVTICSKDRDIYFDSENIRKMIGNTWLELKNKYPNIDLDEFVIMPNHMHGIIVINAVGGETPPLQPKTRTLGQIIAYLKYKTTKEINIFLNNEPGQKLWQRNYYEHIIRNQKSLEEIRKYIRLNPDIWDRDRNNPKNIKNRREK